MVGRIDQDHVVAKRLEVHVNGRVAGGIREEERFEGAFVGNERLLLPSTVGRVDAIALDVVVGDLPAAVGSRDATGGHGGAHELAVVAIVGAGGAQVVEDGNGVGNLRSLGCADVLGHLVLLDLRRALGGRCGGRGVLLVKAAHQAEEHQSHEDDKQHQKEVT